MDPVGEWVEQRAKRGRRARGIALVCVSLAVACRAPRDAREVLAGAATREDTAAVGATQQPHPGEVEPPGGAAAQRTLEEPLTATAAARGEAERDALAALTRADEAAAAGRADATLHAAAARALSTAADLRLQAALVARFRATPAEEPGALVRGEDSLDDETRRAVEGLVREASRQARAALALAPEDLAARQDEAFADSLAAWAMGPTRALMSGAGKRLPKLLAANREAGATREDAAPLRLEGRFLCMAPWPVGDLARGTEALAEAAGHAPTALNLMFLGDARWLAGDAEAAGEAWRAAATAAEGLDPSRDPAGVLVGWLAGQRVVAHQRVTR